jgi:hypothetical protein
MKLQGVDLLRRTERPQERNPMISVGFARVSKKRPCRICGKPLIAALQDMKARKGSVPQSTVSVPDPRFDQTLIDPNLRLCRRFFSCPPKQTYGR